MKIIDQNKPTLKRKKMIKREVKEYTSITRSKYDYKQTPSSKKEVEKIVPMMSLDKRKLSDPLYASKYSQQIYELILKKEVS